LSKRIPTQAHVLSDDTLKRIGYRLLCSVYAEYEWPNLRRDSDPDVLDSFLEHSDEEISELLVSLAALARAADDALDTLAQLEKTFPQGVGTLLINDTKTVLSLRQACNKIIHAKTSRWDFAVEERNPLYDAYFKAQGMDVRGSYKNPKAIISGEDRGGTWEATLFVVPFVIAVANWDAWQWRFV